MVDQLLRIQQEIGQSDLEISSQAQSVDNILFLDLEQKGMRKFMMGFS